MNTTHGVPRSVVLSGMRGRSPKDNLPLWIRQSSGVEQWAAALNADWIGDAIPTRGELARYDLLIANLRVDRLSRLLALATSRPRSQKWVTLIEGDALRQLDPREELRRLLDASDLVITINQKTLRYFQSLTQTRCENIGIPYPVELVRSLAVPYEARERSVLICPRSNRMPSTIVAEALGLPVRVFVKRLSRQFKNVPVMLRHASLAKNLFVRQYSKQWPSHLVTLETSLQHFWKTAATSLIWIDLDPRYTWARFTLDAACLGIPIVTTMSTAHADQLFPETTVQDVFSIDEAIEIGRRLLNDEGFYAHVAGHAAAHLDTYDGKHCVSRLFEALGFNSPEVSYRILDFVNRNPS